MISPSSVITIAEKKKALSPAKTESDSSVSKTLVLTFPQTTVASTELEFLRRSRTHAASALPPSASSCKRNWLRLKMARLRPANSADCATQPIMPSQVQKAMIEGMDACSNLLIRGTSSTRVQGMPRWVLQHIGWRSQRWDRPPALRDAIGSAVTQRELSPVRASRADGDSLPGSLLWSPQNNVAFGAKDIRVEVGDPLPASPSRRGGEWQTECRARRCSNRTVHTCERCRRGSRTRAGG